jgi:uncharacterized protein with NAD-binding domain and iron-sulfur cluster
MPSIPRIRVAVLGGGLGSMAAAFGLTATPELRARYQVTVYQQGWRLGGKGASGRNAAVAQRIEEHGLHAFMGFYENAFRLVRAAYEEWNKKPENPFQTWKDAFTPQRMVTLQDWIDGPDGAGWSTWNITFPRRGGEPGDGDAGPALGEYVARVLHWMRELVEASPLGSDARGAEPGVLSALGSIARGALHAVAEGLEDFALGHRVLAAAQWLAQKLGIETESTAPETRGAILELVDEFRAWSARALDALFEGDRTLYHLGILLDLGAAMVRGLVVDVLPYGKAGFERINHLEFRAWLERHGARPGAGTWSSPVRALYDLAFAWVGGDTSDLANAQIAAGVAAKVVLEIGFGYKDAPLWKMQAGMGDTVFSPLYEVLKQRGVKFEFFHRVKHLGLSPNKHLVKSIELSRQADLVVPEYQPLVEVQNLPCWPSEPQWEQLKDGEALRRAGVNFESAWCTHEVGRRTLELGRDFDKVVLGISVGALKEITSELADAEPAWRAMLEHTRTVQTMAAQLWLTPTLSQLGWKAGTTIMTGYAEPLGSWGEMSHVLPREAWPADHRPGSVHYFCGVLKDAAVIPPPSDPTFPHRETRRAREISREYFERHMGHLWPDAAPPGNPEGLDLRLLVDLHDGTPEQRFDAQYFRANVDPTERYVLSVPGSIAWRLPADGSGFDNLFLAGDWVDTSLNGGCAEAAVEAGFRASRAICGWPAEIAGDEG